MACSHLVCVFKSMNCLFPNISNFFSGFGHLQITESTNAESMVTGVHLNLEMSVNFALPICMATANSCIVSNENMFLEFLWVGDFNKKVVISEKIKMYSYLHIGYSPYPQYIS